MKWFFRIAVLLLLLLVTVAHFKRKDLAAVTGILPEVQQEPIQTSTSEETFFFEYVGREYRVEPQAEYELYGLVVTHNDIHAFADIYHDFDSVDFKDICVIWGENTKNSGFKEITFWSEPWTCWARWGAGEGIGFTMRDLSNNHLLAEDPKVRETIQSMQIGDQVYLKGLLVNYSEPRGSSFVRKSSLSREDTGNGACEVLFVDEARILKSGPQFWRKAYTLGRKALLLVLCLWFIAFLREAYRPMLRRDS